MNSKILTIVIPTYNMEQYLHRCLDSLIVDGGHRDLLEVLVINDGSKDGSSLIAHGYQERYPELFRVIDKENGNYGSCVNRGLREAQGKYVKMLDADDRFFTEGLTVLLDNLCRQDADLVLTDYLTENLKGKVLSERQYHLVPGRTLDFDEVCLAKSLENFQMHGVCYKRRFLLSIGYRQRVFLIRIRNGCLCRWLPSGQFIMSLNLFIVIFGAGWGRQWTRVLSIELSHNSWN